MITSESDALSAKYRPPDMPASGHLSRLSISPSPQGKKLQRLVLKAMIAINKANGTTDYGDKYL
jgi:hypothetical protein